MPNTQDSPELPPPGIVSLAPAHEQHSRRILDAVESHQSISQRSLARELGIALGLTNLLVKRLIRKGWVRAIHIRPNRVRYLLTPAGIVEKTRMSRAYFESSVAFYKETRDRIQQQFMTLSSNWPNQESEPRLPKRIVFYGAGEVAEIGYICLADTDLQLVGVVDAGRQKPFFGFTVSSPDNLDGLTLNGQPFERLIVMSFGRTDELRAEALVRRVPLDHLWWL